MKRIKSVFLILLFCISTLFACGTSANWSLEKNHLIIKNDAGMSEWICFLNSTTEENWAEILDSIHIITLRKGVTVIQGAAFENCHNLTEVYMANSVHTIEEWAFAGCTSLKKICWSKNLKRIEQEAFSDCALEEIHFPDGVQKIMADAFIGCDSLERIILPDSVYEITGVMELENIKQLVFLGNKPDKITNTPIRRYEYYSNKQSVIVYYLNKNQQLWAPNGEKDWFGIPIVGINSLRDLPPLK